MPAHIPQALTRVSVEAAAQLVPHAARRHALQAERHLVQHRGCVQAATAAGRPAWGAQEDARTPAVQAQLFPIRLQPPQAAPTPCQARCSARTCSVGLARRHQARVLVQQQVDLSWARELGRPAKAAQAGVEAAGQLLHAEIDGVPLLRRGESLGRGLRAWSGGAG